MGEFALTNGVSTLGGDPEVARMMGEDIRFHSENSKNCRFVILGKAASYSAGTTFMSFFAAENRYLTRGTRLMIHERKLDKQLHIMISSPRTGRRQHARCQPLKAVIHVRSLSGRDRDFASEVSEGFQIVVSGGATARSRPK